MIRYIYAFVLVISAAQVAVQPTVAAPADNWPHEIPAKAKAILEGAEEFELLSIDPIKPNEHAKDTFHGWQVLGKKKIEKAEVRKELVVAFEKGVEEHESGPAHCFNPRHGIRVASRTQTVDFVICFECFQVRCYQEGEKEQLFLVSHSPADVFNKVLSASGMKLPQAAAAPAAMVAEFEPIPDLNLSEPIVNIDGPFPKLLRKARVGELIQLQIKYVPGEVFPESTYVVLSSRAFSTVGVYATGNEVVVLSAGQPVVGKAGLAYLSVFVKAMNELEGGEIMVKVKMSDGKIKDVPFAFTIRK